MWSLYQSLEESSPMRFHVYYTLVQLAGKTEQTSAIFTNVETVKSQFSAVPPSNEQMQSFSGFFTRCFSPARSPTRPQRLVN